MVTLEVAPVVGVPNTIFVVLPDTPPVPMLTVFV